MTQELGMLSITKVEARAYSRATEVLERVKSAVLNLYPEEIRENIEITTARTTSYSKSPIVVVTAITQVKKYAEKTFTHLFSRLSKKDKIDLKTTLQQRVNEKCNLFVRIDKQAAYLGEVRLARNPDLISMKVSFIMYPHCDRDTVISTIMDQLHTDAE